MPDATEGVPAEWLGWCRRWRETSTIGDKSRHGYYLLLLKAGGLQGQDHQNLQHPRSRRESP